MLNMLIRYIRKYEMNNGLHNLKRAEKIRLDPFVVLPNSETTARDRTLREKDGKTGGTKNE